MAHIEKVKAKSLIGLLYHDGRDANGDRHHDKIDSNKTLDNYVIARATADDGEVRAFHANTADTQSRNMKFARNAVMQRFHTVADNQQAETGRALRNDAVGGISFVVTLPYDWPTDIPDDRFFVATHCFLVEKFGEANCPVSFVHCDETRHHLQSVVIPEVNGKLAANKLLKPAFYKSFHKDLQQYVFERTGVKCSILLPEDEKVEKALSKVPHDALEEVRQAIEERYIRPARIRERESKRKSHDAEVLLKDAQEKNEQASYELMYLRNEVQQLLKDLREKASELEKSDEYENVKRLLFDWPEQTTHGSDGFDYDL